MHNSNVLRRGARLLAIGSLFSVPATLAAQVSEEQQEAVLIYECGKSLVWAEAYSDEVLRVTSNEVWAHFDQFAASHTISEAKAAIALDAYWQEIYDECGAGQDDRLDAFLRSAVGDPKRLSTAGGSTRGLWLPAEPVDSLVSILASTLGNLPAASELDAIVVFGADAPRGLLPFATTDKEWTTPWGEVPAARDLVDALESELDWIRREELRLRSGHALELAVVLARWIYGDECPPILPISCAASSLEPRSDEVEAFGEALELATSRRRILWWSSGALSHCGPAYGGTAAELDQQMELDTACIDAVLRGSPGAFAKRVQLDPRARATGAAPTLALLNRISLDTRAELCAYQRIAAPGGAPGAAGNVGLRFVDV